MLNQRYGRVIQVSTCRLAVRKQVKCTVYKWCARVLWVKVAPNRLNCLIRRCHLTQCLVCCWHGFCAPISVVYMHWSVMCPAAAQCYALFKEYPKIGFHVIFNTSLIRFLYSVTFIMNRLVNFYNITHFPLLKEMASFLGSLGEILAVFI